MGSRRDYAITLGLAVPGRGRLSRAANAACDASGLVFDGPVVKVKSPKTVKPVAAKVTRDTSTPDEDDLNEFNLAERNFPEGSRWKSISGQILNETQVCSDCGYSLGWHGCATPHAVVSPGVLEAVTLIR